MIMKIAAITLAILCAAGAFTIASADNITDAQVVMMFTNSAPTPGDVNDNVHIVLRKTDGTYAWMNFVRNSSAATAMGLVVADEDQRDKLMIGLQISLVSDKLKVHLYDVKKTSSVEYTIHAKSAVIIER